MNILFKIISYDDGGLFGSESLLLSNKIDREKKSIKYLVFF